MTLHPIPMISLILFCVVSVFASDEQAAGPDASTTAFLQGIREPARLAAEAAQAYWSPDGNSICFTKKTKDQDVPGGIYTLRLDGKSEPLRITPSGKDPVWSPNGRWIAYTEEMKENVAQSIWLVDAVGEGKPMLVCEGGYPNWFPDSTHLLVSSVSERVLYRVNIESKSREKLMDLPYPYPTLSPDGQRIALLASGYGLVTCNLDGSEALQINRNPFQGFLGRWSPDGKRIAYGGFLNSGIALSVIGSQNSNDSTTLVNENWTRPAWSPDGKFIVCDTGSPPYEIWLLPSSLRVPGSNELVVHLDVSEVPELEEWGLKGRQFIEDWYQRTINLIPTKNFKVPNEIWLTIHKTNQGVGSTSGTRITVSSGWIEKNPDDFGLVHHELVHVIQNYGRNHPSWLTEGIADYLRWAIYEGKPLSWFPYSDKPGGYRDSYRITGGFFLWLENDLAPGIVQKLNTALRRETYPGEEFFERETGQTVQDLWAEYLQERKENS